MPRPRKSMCLRGHDTSSPESRYPTNRTCKACLAEKDAKKYIRERGTPELSARVIHSQELCMLAALSHYGPKGTLGCCWEGCTVIDPDMLSLDHVNDDGARHKDKNGRRLSSTDMYHWVKRQGYPEGFQTLCMNHQIQKRNEKGRRERSLCKSTAINNRNKLAALAHYGPEETPSCCWEGCTVGNTDMLSIDHVNDDGFKHILPGTKNRLRGNALYCWLRTQKYPEGFQTLCLNHQAKKSNLKYRRERKFGTVPCPELATALLLAAETQATSETRDLTGVTVDFKKKVFGEIV